ncbi:MAG TPA: hypothetical protein VH934_10500 [Xanthobacteraceae bacterium]|jgi:hypothetical protein
MAILVLIWAFGGFTNGLRAAFWPGWSDLAVGERRKLGGRASGSRDSLA